MYDRLTVAVGGPAWAAVSVVVDPVRHYKPSGVTVVLERLCIMFLLFL